MSWTTPELESLELRLRDAFRRADLPAAPGRLRTELETLPAATRVPTDHRGHIRLSRSSALGTLLAAAAVIATVAVGLPLLQPRSQTGPASATGSHLVPTTTPSSTPGPTLSPQPVVMASDGSSISGDGPSITWTNVPLARFGSNIVSAVGAGQIGGTLVVAANDSTQNDAKPVIIDSRNGIDWTKVPTDGAEFANARLDYLLSVPGGLLLVGESILMDPLCAGGATGCNPVSATLMWHSSDGRTWQPLSAAELAPFDRVWIYSISAGAKGLVAFGLHQPVEQSSPDQSVVFHSVDGTGWVSANFPDQNGEPAGLDVQNVTASPSGFVAVGYVNTAATGGQTAEGAAWYSEDGLTWTRAAAPAGATDGMLYSAAGSAGMVAVATDNAVWVSADGRAWQTDETSPFISGSGWLTSDGNEILVIRGGSVAWSLNGMTWHRGESIPPMPGLGTVGTTNRAWILGATVIAASPDDLSLYVGRVAGR